jgi:hypothetical protein
MKIFNLKDIPNKILFLEKDKNKREIYHYFLNDVMLSGDSSFYPNTLLYCYENKTLYNPSEERTMSLFNNINIEDKYTNLSLPDICKTENCPVFFFIYNTDNYFHFIYDSLPYLISYRELKKKYPNMKLLINYPNESRKDLYRFVTETYDLLQIKNADILFADQSTLYKKIFLASSYTHGDNSNLPPRKEIFRIYKELKNIVDSTNKYESISKNIYISRRSWIHNDVSNIGTNYTTRRKMMNEDSLVQKLESRGFKEIFTETLNTIDKIKIFSSAEKVVGAIGGGVANVLFSEPNTELVTITSPGFLEVNERFKFTLNNVNVKYTKNCKHITDSKFKKYMRATTKDGSIIGEISEVLTDDVIVSYTENKVAGWNASVVYKFITIPKNDIILLDNGLNSEWAADIEEIMDLIT